jgi:hypothetical protein
MHMNCKTLFLISAFGLAFGSVPAVRAQAAAPAVPSTAPGSAGLTITNPGVTAQGNNSGGTAPGPVYPGPAAMSGANSPPVNSGITDPKTGANNDTVPLKDSGRANPPNPGVSGN